MSWPILSIVTFLPTVGGLLILIIRGDDAAARRNIYYIAFWTTVVTFVLSLLLWLNFNNSDAGFQFVEEAPWLSSPLRR